MCQAYVLLLKLLALIQINVQVVIQTLVNKSRINTCLDLMKAYIIWKSEHLQYIFIVNPSFIQATTSLLIVR